MTLSDKYVSILLPPPPLSHAHVINVWPPIRGLPVSVKSTFFAVQTNKSSLAVHTLEAIRENFTNFSSLLL